MIKKRYGKSIRSQLLISFFFIVFLMVLVGIASIYHVKRVYNNGNEIYVTNLNTLDYLKSLNINVRRIDKLISDVFDSEANEPEEGYRSIIEGILDENTSLMFKYENLDYSKKEKEKYNECREKLVVFNKHVIDLLELVDQKEIDKALDLYSNELMPVEEEVCNLIEEVADIATEDAEIRNDDNFESYQNVVLAIVFTMIMTTILAVLISIRVSTRFTDKLAIIQRWAKRISEYNVAEDIKVIENDEFGTTSKALNDSQFMIRDLVEKIMEESALISDTGREVSDAVRKTKQRLENINLQILEANVTEKENLDKVEALMRSESLSPEFKDQINDLIAFIKQNNDKQDDFCKELATMATYMEQIAITSDYQNKIAETHRAQVGKFRIKADD